MDCPINEKVYQKALIILTYQGVQWYKQSLFLNSFGEFILITGQDFLDREGKAKWKRSPHAV